MARIALVHDVAGVAETQARILRDAGHEVDQLRLPDFGADWGFLAKATTLPIRLLLYLPTILRLRRESYDVIHIHWVPRGIVGILSQKPFLVQAHGSDLHQHVNTPGLHGLCRLVLDRARAILYVTPNLVEYIRRFDGKLTYLPNPIDVVALAPSPKPPQRIRRALIFARLDPIKGVDRVFPAAEQLACEIEFTAMAWGPLTQDYVLRYGRSVRFIDPVPHGEIGSLLQQFDVVIGQMDQGALGLSELESLAAGRPLVTGIDRSMYPGDKPPVVSAGSSNELVDQLTRLMHDGKRLANLSYEGREWVRRNHGFERHLHLLEMAYFGRGRDLARVA